MTCCETQKINLVLTDEERLIAGDMVQTCGVYLTAGKAIKRGDLLKSDPATNKVSVATDASDWNFIAVQSLTVEQVNHQVTKDLGMQAYNQGEFHIGAILLNGLPLPVADYKKAMAKGNIQKIELRQSK